MAVDDVMIVLEGSLAVSTGAGAVTAGPGERTETFRLGKDQLLTNENGSNISFEDFAVTLVDEIEAPAHVRQRFTVGY